MTYESKNFHAQKTFADVKKLSRLETLKRLSVNSVVQEEES